MVALHEMTFTFTSMENLPLLCITLLSIFILYLSVRRRSISRRSNENMIPSPPKLPFIGNIHQLSSLYHQSLYMLSQKYGPLMLLRLGEVPWLVVSSSDMACAIMRTYDLTFASRPSAVVSDILRFQDMAFEPYGEDWRQLKKIFTIHLMGKKVSSYKTIREEEVGKLIAKITDHASLSSSDPIELSKLLFSFMIDIVCRVVSGKFIMEERRYALMKEVVEENFRLVGRFSIGDLFPSLTWLEGFIGLSKKANRNRKKWDLLFDELIQAHVQSDENKEKIDNFVDILLSLKNDPNNNLDLTMEQMKGLLADAFAAGIDTTYITLDWAMSELIKNPDVMKKLQEEVRRIVNDKDIVRTEDLNQMSYLKYVVKETLRLHPAIPLLLPRESMEDSEINGFIIPEGTKVIINAWAINRETKSWEQSEEFIPERFIGSAVDFKGNDFQFIPFGAGRRICPGISFATATTELALANLVHRFDWELPSGMTREEFNMEDSPGLSVHRKDELRLVVKKVQPSH